jgi:hypothetical protein
VYRPKCLNVGTALIMVITCRTYGLQRGLAAWGSKSPLFCKGVWTVRSPDFINTTVLGSSVYVREKVNISLYLLSLGPLKLMYIV